MIGPICQDQWVQVDTISNPDGSYKAIQRVPSPDRLHTQAGCAGSVAVNLARLNNEVSLLTHSSDYSSLFKDFNLEELDYLSFSLAREDKTYRLSSTKARYINNKFQPILRLDYPSKTNPLTLDDLCNTTRRLKPEAVYIADYEAHTKDDGIASAKTIGKYCDWLAEEYKGITISDSRRAVYNTQYVKTNKKEWAQIVENKAWHYNQDFLVSMGAEGLAMYSSYCKNRTLQIPEQFCKFEREGNWKTISTCGAGDVVTSVFLDRILKGESIKNAASLANYWASEATTRPYTCRVSLKAAI